MINKIILSPFFVMGTFLVLWLSFVAYVYYGHTENILNFTMEGGVVEGIAHFGYVLLIALLLLVSNDYRDKIRTWGILLFLALCAFLREAGIHHHLSKTDTTPFKSRFFTSPNNPLSEKILYGMLLLVILSAVLYLAYKYAKPLFVSFFKLDVISWSVATLCFVGVVSKYIDRYPANWRKAHGGVYLPDDVYAVFQLVEESMEMFLPYIACMILLQYRLLKKN